MDLSFTLILEQNLLEINWICVQKTKIFAVIDIFQK